MTPVTIADGITEPGATLYFVTARGAVKSFVLLRSDIWHDTPFSESAVIVAEGGGLYDPGSCFIEERRAKAEGEQRRTGYRDYAAGLMVEFGGEG